MKKLSFFLLPLAILFCGCPYISNYTLCDVKPPRYKKELLGLWINKEGNTQIHFAIDRDEYVRYSVYHKPDNSEYWEHLKSDELSLAKIAGNYFFEYAEPENKKYASFKYEFLSTDEIVVTGLNNHFEPLQFINSSSSYRRIVLENINEPLLFDTLNSHFYRSHLKMNFKPNPPPTVISDDVKAGIGIFFIGMALWTMFDDSSVCDECYGSGTVTGWDRLKHTCPKCYGSGKIYK